MLQKINSKGININNCYLEEFFFYIDYICNETNIKVFNSFLNCNNFEVRKIFFNSECVNYNIFYNLYWNYISNQSTKNLTHSELFLYNKVETFFKNSLNWQTALINKGYYLRRIDREKSTRRKRVYYPQLIRYYLDQKIKYTSMNKTEDWRLIRPRVIGCYVWRILSGLQNVWTPGWHSIVTPNIYIKEVDKTLIYENEEITFKPSLISLT